ncbi:MAG: hypothetical protein F4Y03_16095 [Alphaproteobacteria bacterium]|nr:hypothetical protein [Alphaproteobacteria bacterium]
MADRLKVEWLGHGLEPTWPLDPLYPDGVDLVMPSVVSKLSCKVELAYPAEGAGSWRVHCTACGLTFEVAAGGRADDARSLQVYCTAGTPEAKDGPERRRRVLRQPVIPIRIGAPEGPADA